MRSDRIGLAFIFESVNFRQRQENRYNERAVNDPHDTKKLDAADNADKYEKGIHFHSLADQSGLDKILDRRAVKQTVNQKAKTGVYLRAALLGPLFLFQTPEAQNQRHKKSLLHRGPLYSRQNRCCCGGAERTAAENS